MNDTNDRSDVSVRNPASNPALKRWPRRHRQVSGTGPLGPVSVRDSVMSTLRAARAGPQSNTATVRSLKAAYQPGRCISLVIPVASCVGSMACRCDLEQAPDR